MNLEVQQRESAVNECDGGKRYCANEAALAVHPESGNLIAQPEDAEITASEEKRKRRKKLPRKEAAGSRSAGSRRQGDEISRQDRRQASERKHAEAVQNLDRRSEEHNSSSSGVF